MQITFGNSWGNPARLTGSLWLGDQELSGVLDLSGVETIKNSTFYNMDKITEVKFDENLKTIGHYAFSECDGLTSMTLPEGMITLGSYAFYNCSG